MVPAVNLVNLNASPPPPAAPPLAASGSVAMAQRTPTSSLATAAGTSAASLAVLDTATVLGAGHTTLRDAAQRARSAAADVASAERRRWLSRWLAADGAAARLPAGVNDWRLRL